MNAKPSVTIVVEWDNLHFADERATAVMQLVAREAENLGDEVRTPVELILAYDGDEAGEALLGPLVENLSSVSPVYLAAPGKRYYELKNTAAAKAHGDVLVFLDSDVVPEPGWLGRLVAPFADPEVHVVGGNAYIDPSGISGKTFALAWFFPLRTDEDRLEPATSFFANKWPFAGRPSNASPFPTRRAARAARARSSPRRCAATGSRSTARPAPA